MSSIKSFFIDKSVFFTKVNTEKSSRYHFQIVILNEILEKCVILVNQAYFFKRYDFIIKN